MQSVKEIQCRPAVILEISRQSPASTREELVEEAKQYDKMGADILCLKARYRCQQTMANRKIRPVKAR